MLPLRYGPSSRKISCIPKTQHSDYGSNWNRSQFLDKDLHMKALMYAWCPCAYSAMQNFNRKAKYETKSLHDTCLTAYISVTPAPTAKKAQRTFQACFVCSHRTDSWDPELRSLTPGRLKLAVTGLGRFGVSIFGPGVPL